MAPLAGRGGTAAWSPSSAIPRRALVFTGFMGAGKSTAAAEVARELGGEVLDTDRLLEARLGHSIAREFELHGESSFRAHEEELVCQLLAQAGPGVVIALGGGAVLSARVRGALAAHVAVLLEIDPSHAWERVRAHAGERPLARDPEAFAALHAERRGCYEGLADAILPADRPGVAVRALPALRMLAAAAPKTARLLWAAAASGEYPVIVSRGLLELARGPAGWPLDRGASRPFCVADETVGALYAQRLGELAALIAIPPGSPRRRSPPPRACGVIWRRRA